MDIWVVTANGADEGYEMYVCGVFSNQKQAETYAKTRNGEVECFPLDSEVRDGE